MELDSDRTFSIELSAECDVHAFRSLVFASSDQPLIQPDELNKRSKQHISVQYPDLLKTLCNVFIKTE